MAERANTGNNVALALCEMLNIKPDCVTGITVEADINDIARVQIRGIVRTPEGRPIIGDRVSTFSKRYQIVEIVDEDA